MKAKLRMQINLYLKIEKLIFIIHLMMFITTYVRMDQNQGHGLLIEERE